MQNLQEIKYRLKETFVNILFLTSWYPTKKNPAAAIFVHEHGLAFKEAGMQLKVIQIVAEPSDKHFYKKEINEFTKDGIDVTTIKILSRAHKLVNLFWPLYYKILKKYYFKNIHSDFKPDLIHANVIYPAGILGYDLSKDLNIPFTLTEHWTNLNWVFGKPFFKNKAIKAYKSASKIFPVSKFLGDQINAVVGCNHKTKVIPNIVNPDMFHFKAKEPQETIQLLCVTNFWLNKKKMHKRPDVLIEAIKLLKKSDQKKIQLTFIGRGGKQETLRKEIENSDISTRIEFLGGQPKEEIANRMQKADYLLQPTEKETFGVVIAEAACTGLPCIVTELEVLKELVDENNGGFVLENTPELWAEEIKKIIEGEYSFDRESIAEKYQNRFSYSTVGASYRSEIEAVLD